MPLSEGGTDGGQRRSHRACPGGGQVHHAGHGAAQGHPGRRRQTSREVAGLLLVEVLGTPRARAAALSLARSLAGWLPGRRPPASAGVEVTTRQVTVVQHADTSVLVHRVEAALVVRIPAVARGWPADEEQRPGSKGQRR
jgi:hypothetical protein